MRDKVERVSAVEVSCLAVSVVLAAVVLVLLSQSRRSRQELRQLQDSVAALTRQSSVATSGESSHLGEAHGAERDPAHTAPPPGRPDQLVLVPTTGHVVEATLGAPLVRAVVLGHGLQRALRPESRDRVRALMRREFSRRRKVRQRAGRRAAREAGVHARSTGSVPSAEEGWS